jgi:hypothetical protein
MVEPRPLCKVSSKQLDQGFAAFSKDDASEQHGAKEKVPLHPAESSTAHFSGWQNSY